MSIFSAAICAETGVRFTITLLLAIHLLATPLLGRVSLATGCSLKTFFVLISVFTFFWALGGNAAGSGADVGAGNQRRLMHIAERLYMFISKLPFIQ